MMSFKQREEDIECYNRKMELIEDENRKERERAS